MLSLYSRRVVDKNGKYKKAVKSFDRALDQSLGQMEEKEIDILGTYPVSKGIVSLQNDLKFFSNHTNNQTIYNYHFHRNLQYCINFF